VASEDEIESIQTKTTTKKQLLQTVYRPGYYRNLLKKVNDQVTSECNDFSLLKKANQEESNSGAQLSTGATSVSQEDPVQETKAVE